MRSRHSIAMWAVWPLALAFLGLGGCGGGGGGGGNLAPPVNPPGSGWIQGVFMPSATFAAQCSTPRTGNDPDTGAPYPDVQGSVVSENNWLRSWSNELYLWYDEIVDQDPGLFTTPDYFDELKTNALTPSGNPKDRFHFTYATDEWRQLSQSGVSAGYGARFLVLSGLPPREVVVAYTEPNSPATTGQANLARGARILEIDGVDIDDPTPAGVDKINAGISPSQLGESHDFRVRDLDGSERAFTMQTANVTQDPVQDVQRLSLPTGDIGYMVFNSHIATAEQELIDAITLLSGVDDLVLDLRYNGGGFLYIASQLAYMIAGPNNTAGFTFELLQFNDQHPSTDPVTGNPIEPVPFYDGSTMGAFLPTLNLSRVFVLTGLSTCSASESVINSLRGVGVEVIQIGSTTCGKPYGFYPADNCGTTYFTIEFRGVNEQDFGDYPDGFSPANTVGTAGVTTPGCSVGDDFDHQFGDPNEARLAAALAYRDNPTCPAPSGFAPSGLSKPGVPLQPRDGTLIRPPSEEMRILGRP